MKKKKKILPPLQGISSSFTFYTHKDFFFHNGSWETNQEVHDGTTQTLLNSNNITLLYFAITSLWLMSNLHCNISCFNTPRKNISSCLASPIKTRSKSGPNLTPLTLVTAKKLQDSKLILLKFNYSKTRRTSQRYPCKKNLPSIPENDYS